MSSLHHTRTGRLEDYLVHAQFHARDSPSGIGAAVVRSTFEGGHRLWDCIVTDGGEWHYLRVLGDEVGPFPDFSVEDIELAIERFASTLPTPSRIRHLQSANPLHLRRDGEVRD
jgi:hypothetical protein